MVATVLVTGATGFVGSHCIRILLRQGYKVKGTVRSLKNPERVKYLYNLCPNSAHQLELVEADLNHEGPWANIVKDCDYVLHVASPVNFSPDATEEELVKPAVEGALMVLRACRDSGTVKRVVLTSSNTVLSGLLSREEPYTEADWIDPNKEMAILYIKGKALAEKAAWDFVKSLPADKRFELAVILPTFIIGPSLSPSMTESLSFFKAVIEGWPPMKHSFGICDVRDVAQAHINAINVPAAAGNRHIIVSGHIWSQDIAKLLKAEFGPQGYPVVTEVVSTGQPLPIHDTKVTYDGTRVRQVLGINPIPMEISFLDMVYGMIEAGHIEKKAGYKGPKCSD